MFLAFISLTICVTASNSYFLDYFCLMRALNFDPFSFRFKSSENKTLIFDEIRKKFIILTPEEWVRQHVVHYLIHIKKYPQSLINVEKKLNINGVTKRYDIVVYQSTGDVFLLVECKAPEIEIKQETFDQIARYNMALQATYLMVTNGIYHYYCSLDYTAEKYFFMPDLPEYKVN